MADEPAPGPSSVWEPILFIGLLIGALLGVAIYRGTIKNIHTQGFFQSPLPPVGDGSTYTPTGLKLPGMPGQTTHSTTTATTTNTPR